MWSGEFCFACHGPLPPPDRLKGWMRKWVCIDRNGHVHDVSFYGKGYFSRKERGEFYATIFEYCYNWSSTERVTYGIFLPTTCYTLVNKHLTWSPKDVVDYAFQTNKDLINSNVLSTVDYGGDIRKYCTAHTPYEFKFDIDQLEHDKKQYLITRPPYNSPKSSKTVPDGVKNAHRILKNWQAILKRVDAYKDEWKKAFLIN